MNIPFVLLVLVQNRPLLILVLFLFLFGFSDLSSDGRIPAAGTHRRENICCGLIIQHSPRQESRRVRTGVQDILTHVVGLAALGHWEVRRWWLASARYKNNRLDQDIPYWFSFGFLIRLIPRSTGEGIDVSGRRHCEVGCRSWLFVLCDRMKQELVSNGSLILLVGNSCLYKVSHARADPDLRHRVSFGPLCAGMHKRAGFASAKHE